MVKQVETEGIVLSSTPYREKDRLVKIFTESYGKMMFFVRRGSKQNFMYKTAIQPLNGGDYLLRINDEGLSFINTVKSEFSYGKIQQDFMRHSYAMYLTSLANAAIDDHVADPLLYGFLKQSLTCLDEGYDADVILNIFELQLLPRFGVQPEFHHCTLCGETSLTVPFDYSSETGGVICYRHFNEGLNRYHAHPRAVYFARLFQEISLEQIKTIQLKDDTKQWIRALIDQLYDEYVGLSLKSKQFLEKMAQGSTAIQQAQRSLIDKRKKNQ